MSAPAAGRVIDGKYRLLEPIGSGGMGSVWKAEHLSLRSLCAVKLMHRRIAGADALERFVREARAAAALRSPHVVSVLDSGVSDETPYVVMELLEGEALDQRLRRLTKLDFGQTLAIVTQVARALSRAHEAGIVHRDLKPANVFLQHNADEELCKVLDFGVAKLSPIEGLSPLTRTGAVLGSPHYMSPEQARGKKDVDHRTDCWALGIIAFECVTGRRPFDSDVLGDLLLKICTEPAPVPSSLAELPPGFDAWFARAVERDPDQRFQSAHELAEALRALAPRAAPTLAPSQPYLPSAPAAATVVPTPSRAGSPLAAVAVAAALLFAVVLIAAGGIAAVLMFDLMPGSQPEPSARAVAPDGGAPAADAASTSSASPSSSAPVAATQPSPKHTSTARATSPATTATATATSAATGSTAASSNDACVKACNKLRACAPGANCDSSGACTGFKRVLADCVNRTPCAKIADECVP